MADWVRRNYDAIGVTQTPPGPYLPAVQDPYLGKVILCIDVSGSMALVSRGRTQLDWAVAGAERFVQEAFDAAYKVGIVLWHHGVHHFEPLTRDPKLVLKALRSARSSGSNNITPTLRLGIAELGHLPGDRVMAIFGDGDIGPVGPAKAVAKQAAALGIRIIVRGLGDHAARELARIATETGDDTIRTAADIESGIASMVAAVTRRGKRRG